MSDTKLVRYRREGLVGFLTLSRPEKMNALNPQVWLALDEALAEAEADAEARVVVLRGEGRAFSVGLDLGLENELLTMMTEPAGAAQKKRFFRAVRRCQAIHTRLERLRPPVIGLVHGYCLGAGLELALCADFRYCSAETVFALPESRLGVVADVGGPQRLTRFVGKAKAREIIFRGHRFDSAQAKRIKLVNEVFPDLESLEAGVMAAAREIAGNPPLAVQGAKQVFLFDREVDLDESLEYTAARSCMIAPSQDLTEAVTAYIEKRTGDFKGA